MGNSSSSADNGSSEKLIAQELEAKKAELEKKIVELEKKKAEVNAKQAEIAEKDKTITGLNNDILTYKSCEEKDDKLMIALRRYQNAPGFVKVLFDNKDWLMYIVKDFDKNWKTHKWFKYLWNIAFIFRNTSNAIILFGARNNGISPIRSPANFKSINKGFINALAIDPQLTAYNMYYITTNPLLASDYKISFWGAYRQKPGDSDEYTYSRTLSHDQTGDKRHDNRNQTAWMWNWINNTVYDPTKYPNVKASKEDIDEFAKKGRIVGNFAFKHTKPNSEPDRLEITGMYVKRPTADGYIQT